LRKYPGQDGEDKVQFLLGWSYLVSGDNAKAVEAFDLVMKQHPGSEYAVKARDFIARLKEK